VKDDDGSRDEIFLDQPRYVPHRRVHGVMRVRAAKDALVPVVTVPLIPYAPLVSPEITDQHHVLF
jgi:hypothetical protein